MRGVSSFLFIFSISIGLIIIPPDGMSQNSAWRKVDEGLFLAEFDPFYETLSKDSKIIIVKISPSYYSFKLLCSSELGKMRLTPKEWCKRYNLMSAINAGMYQ